MKIAITGGTGFVGRNIARRLAGNGHEVVLIARGNDQTDPAIRHLANAQFFQIGLGDANKLAEAFAGCDAIAHCAGINRECGDQTYQRVHIEGTHNVVEAARKAGVRKIVLISFLRARDHMLDHLSHAFHTFPIFAFVGFRDKPIRPNAVEDVARICTNNRRPSRRKVLLNQS